MPTSQEHEKPGIKVRNPDDEQTYTGMFVTNTVKLTVANNSTPILTASQFKAALKEMGAKLGDKEDAYWSAKAEAGRKSGIQNAAVTADRVKRRKGANPKGV